MIQMCNFPSEIIFKWHTLHMHDKAAFNIWSNAVIGVIGRPLITSV